MLPPDESLKSDPDDVLDIIDGLILAGGADIDPATYGQAPHAATRGTVPERDAFEIALTRRAIERDMPVLGICRGMQLMNVARGGTLLQHLPESQGHDEHRRNPGTFDGAEHDVRLERARSRRARPAGRARHEVPPPPGRRPPRRGPGSPAGPASTGCPRRSSRPSRRFVLGVQWHPEADGEPPRRRARQPRLPRRATATVDGRAQRAARRPSHGAVALAANASIAVAKLVAGLISGSSAMLAEAAHSVADTMNQVFLLFSLSMGEREPDAEHPFGYGKERFFWSFLAAVGIFVAGAGFSLYEGLHRIFGPRPRRAPTGIAYAVLAFAFVAEGTSLVRAGATRGARRVQAASPTRATCAPAATRRRRRSSSRTRPPSSASGSPSPASRCTRRPATRSTTAWRRCDRRAAGGGRRRAGARHASAADRRGGHAGGAPGDHGDPRGAPRGRSPAGGAHDGARARPAARRCADRPRRRPRAPSEVERASSAIDRELRERVPGVGRCSSTRRRAPRRSAPLGSRLAAGSLRPPRGVLRHPLGYAAMQARLRPERARLTSAFEPPVETRRRRPIAACETPPSSWMTSAGRWRSGSARAADEARRSSERVTRSWGRPRVGEHGLVRLEVGGARGAPQLVERAVADDRVEPGLRAMSRSSARSAGARGRRRPGRTPRRRGAAAEHLAGVGHETGLVAGVDGGEARSSPARTAATRPSSAAERRRSGAGGAA